MRDSRVLLSLALTALVATGCLENPGIDPPERALNFPIALTLSDGGGGPSAHLFVANANFDLRYNAGSLQSFSLDALEGCLTNLCVGPDAANPLIEGGVCALGLWDTDPLPCPGLFVDEVLVGSFADGLTLAPGGGRLYLPIRSEGALSFVDVAVDGTLACGMDRSCDSDHRQAVSTLETAAGETLPTDPVDIHAGSLETDFGLAPGSGNYLLMAHRQGAASLFLDSGDPSAAPVLIDVLDGLSTDLVGIRRDPIRGDFSSASSVVAGLQRIGVATDPSAPTQSFLYNEGSLSISGLDTGRVGYDDARDVVFDPRAGVDRTYVLSRSPEALVGLDRLNLAGGWVVEVGRGPSRLAVAEHVAVGRTLAYVSCFDSRSVYVIDVDLGLVVSVIRGMSGPFELTVDRDRGWLMLVDFRASVVRVFDLNPMLACLGGTSSTACSPVQRGMIGTPRPVEELR